MEEGQLESDSQQPPQEEAAQEGGQASDQVPLQTLASANVQPQTLDQEETQLGIKEKNNSASQSQGKLLWKPIPPLLPESHTETRDQSCQTEERLQQSSTNSHGHHHTGG